MNNKKIFLFDTNVYRYIAEMASTQRIYGDRFIVDEMIRRERQNNCRSIMSLTTTQELLQHLIVDESAYDSCYNALRFQFFHTQDLSASVNRKKPIPQLESILTFFFYDTDTKDNRLKVCQFILDTVEKIFWEQIGVSTLKNDVQCINDDFLTNKVVFYNLFRDLVSQSRNIKANGDYKKGDENPEFLKALKKEDHIVFIRKFLIERAKYSCQEGVSKDIDNEKENSFILYFKESFLQFQYLFEVLRDNPKSLENDKSEKWNAVNDFHLIFEWCFVKYCVRNTDKQVILITDDKKKNNKNLSSYQNGKGRNCDVWPMKAYFEFLDFSIEGTSYDNYIIHFEKLLTDDGLPKSCIELPNAEECDATTDAMKN